ncbi:hypothetical protein LSCM1_03229 [Leishmania martiniquensis]|uniref:Uncharacterized protein n=1 Tax=Leishmania martiniquensis TaxID=1580590 RepID=A0A836HCP6_9TRYP|nr:hypothetical protein LSCM1_03229 [Leishmania martiniquensis]
MSCETFSLHSPFEEPSLFPAETPMGALSAPQRNCIVTPERSQHDNVAAVAMPAGHVEVQPLDVSILPLLFFVTYWCGLAIVYAFMVYAMVASAAWRGPVIMWALLLPTVVFSLWRRLPSERCLLEAKSAEVILLRCGGYYALAEPESSPDCRHEELQVHQYYPSLIPSAAACAIR